MDRFVEWLDAEMIRRGISTDVELAKRGGFSSGSLTNLRKGSRKLGVKLAVGIAKGLDLPPEEVMRWGDILPAQREELAKGNLTLLQIFEIAKKLSPTDQKELMDYALYLLRERR